MNRIGIVVVAAFAATGTATPPLEMITRQRFQPRRVALGVAVVDVHILACDIAKGTQAIDEGCDVFSLVLLRIESVPSISCHEPLRRK
jgi:hypothetical protein